MHFYIMGFPGRIGPGLIEASWSRSSIGHLFPEFPGRIGPGLIEACRTGRWPRARTYFPGELARASLKRRQHRGPQRGAAVQHFPGELARASLKPPHAGL